MATPKPTRSPRRAQLPALPLYRVSRAWQRPLKHPLWKLPVYETLHALNRDFEQVLADLEKLRKLGLSPPEGSTIYAARWRAGSPRKCHWMIDAVSEN